MIGAKIECDMACGQVCRCVLSLKSGLSNDVETGLNSTANRKYSKFQTLLYPALFFLTGFNDFVRPNVPIIMSCIAFATPIVVGSQKETDRC